MQFKIILPGAPRTKKNSQRVLPMISGAGIIELIAALKKSTSHRESIGALMRLIGFSVQPSEKYQEWFELQYWRRSKIQDLAAAQGVKLPVLEPISISAKVYRDADRGDFNGYTDAIADAIQADQWICNYCRKKTIVLAKCAFCGGSIAAMQHHRKGLNIIGDDAQINHWDGTRLYIDRERPRLELTVRIEPAQEPAQKGLF